MEALAAIRLHESPAAEWRVAVYRSERVGDQGGGVESAASLNPGVAKRGRWIDRG